MSKDDSLHGGQATRSRGKELSQILSASQTVGILFYFIFWFSLLNIYFQLDYVWTESHDCDAGLDLMMIDL